MRPEEGELIGRGRGDEPGERLEVREPRPLPPVGVGEEGREEVLAVGPLGWVCALVVKRRGAEQTKSVKKSKVPPTSGLAAAKWSVFRRKRARGRAERGRERERGEGEGEVTE